MNLPHPFPAALHPTAAEAVAEHLARLDRAALVAAIGTLKAQAAELDGRRYWAIRRFGNPDAARDLRQVAQALDLLLTRLDG